MWCRFLVSLAAICLASAAVIPPINVDTSKIVGGQNVTIEEFAWQVSLFNLTNGRHFCGGTILDAYTILTAAHCIRDNRPVGVRVGSTLHRTGGRTRTVNRIVVHEGFNRTTLDNDIALVFVRQPLRYSESVFPARLPEFAYDLANNVSVWVSGWGTRQIQNETLPEHLQAVKVQIVDQDSCAAAYQASNKLITDSMFCAGIYPGGGKDSCQGDSGGPVVEFYGERRIVHGIVSWGRGCGLTDYPGVYTRVSRYLEWIRIQQDL